MGVARLSKEDIDAAGRPCRFSDVAFVALLSFHHYPSAIDERSPRVSTSLLRLLQCLSLRNVQSRRVHAAQPQMAYKSNVSRTSMARWLPTPSRSCYVQAAVT